MLAPVRVRNKIIVHKIKLLTVIKLNAAVRPQGLSYSRFIDRLKKNKVELDRKVLADLAEHHPEVFAEIVKLVK